MTAQMTPSERQLRTLARIVGEDRADLPARGLPLSLLSDLKDLIHCNAVSFEGFDSGRRETWFCGAVPNLDESACAEFEAAYGAVHWQHYWDCRPCCYPDRTGDLRMSPRSRTSTRSANGTALACTQTCTARRAWSTSRCSRCPADPGGVSSPGRTLRLFLFRGPGI